jgi:hypothetical protein
VEIILAEILDFLKFYPNVSVLELREFKVVIIWILFNVNFERFNLKFKKKQLQITYKSIRFRNFPTYIII